MTDSDLTVYDELGTISFAYEVGENPSKVKAASWDVFHSAFDVGCSMFDVFRSSLLFPQKKIWLTPHRIAKLRDLNGQRIVS